MTALKRRMADIRRAGHRIAMIELFRTAGVEKILAHQPTGTRCFVSIDVDVLDMPLVPGCVSAEPDGLAYAELRGALKLVAERLDVGGFDLVEINPLLDVPTGATAYLGAHTIIQFLGYICAQPRWVERRNGRA